MVATPIGNLGDLSPRAIQALSDADVIACEDTRHTRALLAHAGIRAKRLVALHEHNESSAAQMVLGLVEEGATVAVVSDAGMPGISDPGQRLVRAAADAGIDVSVVPGPSALLAALAVSGLASDRFVFEGFLARKGKARAQALEGMAHEMRTTVIFESPRRLAATVADLARTCGAERRVALARELTKMFEETWRGTLAEALDKVDADPIRGEYVIVLAGAAPAAGTDTAAVEVALAQEIENGATTKTAVDRVHEATGLPRRQVYEMALAVKSRR